MNPFQRFFFVVALIGGLILYVAGIVLLDPPLHAALFAKEEVTVTTATIETREADPPSLPAIDVRSADGEVTLLQGYRWMDSSSATETAALYPLGQSIKAVRYDGKLWRGISGFRGTLLLVVSLFGAFVALFGLWMVWKVRKQ